MGIRKTGGLPNRICMVHLCVQVVVTLIDYGMSYQNFIQEMRDICGFSHDQVDTFKSKFLINMCQHLNMLGTYFRYLGRYSTQLLYLPSTGFVIPVLWIRIWWDPELFAASVNNNI